MPEPTPRPEADDAVRRLLAEARHDEPVPPDVADRLDRVLAGLRAEGPRHEDAAEAGSPDGDEHHRAASLALARSARRRTATRLLVAAAAVLVVGVAVGQVLGRVDPSGSQSSMDSGGSAASQAEPRDTPRAAVGAGGDASDGISTEPGAAPGYAELAPSLPLTLTAADFDADVRAAVVRASRLRPSLQDDGPLAGALAESLPGWTCGTGTSTRAYGRGVLLPATYDGTPVVLALRPAAGDGIPVRVLACGSAQVLRSATLDAS